MIDGVGNVQRLLVVGEPNRYSMAIVSELVGPRLGDVVLASRSSTTTAQAAEEIRSWGVPNVATPTYEPLEAITHRGLIDSVFKAGDVDVTILADELRLNEESFELDPESAVQVVMHNLTAPVSIGLNVVRNLREQGHGVLIIVTRTGKQRGQSIGDVNRATQTGLQTFAQGLGERLRKSGARTGLIKIGDDREVKTSELRAATAQIIKSRGNQTVSIPKSFGLKLGR